MSGCFVLRVDQSLSEGVSRFKINREVVFVENPGVKEVQFIILNQKFNMDEWEFIDISINVVISFDFVMYYLKKSVTLQVSHL